ncbi:SRPBCC family protein [Pseudonocardia spinosispora]|uniref:SRPBCC family protein n=1 Tax=Pseudonocardia spinosispora TaxID=103441 RepID=UPI00040002E3|nr:SRPBCC family protein [Pseudonocardia spinosispora]
MELTNTFRVAGPVERVWAVVTDAERVAPCVPGAALSGTDGEDHRGSVTVTAGAVTARFEGVARFTERDDAEHHAVLRADGRDVRGQGEAAATIDVRLARRGDGTEVIVLTDLELTGQIARLGHGVVAAAVGKHIGRFARRLDDELRQEPVDEVAVGTGASRPTTWAGPTEHVGPVLPRLALWALALGLLGWWAARVGRHPVGGMRTVHPAKGHRWTPGPWR